MTVPYGISRLSKFVSCQFAGKFAKDVLFREGKTASTMYKLLLAGLRLFFSCSLSHLS